MPEYLYRRESLRLTIDAHIDASPNKIGGPFHLFAIPHDVNVAVICKTEQTRSVNCAECLRTDRPPQAFGRARGTRVARRRIAGIPSPRRRPDALALPRLGHQGTPSDPLSARRRS